MKKFNPGDYCRFEPEEIPTIIALLKANGWRVCHRQEEDFDESHDIISIAYKDFYSINSSLSHGATNELSKHDFMVTALRLQEGDGMRSDASTSEQRRHVLESLSKAGAYVQYQGIEVLGFSLIKGEFAKGLTDNQINHIDYNDWCKRLNFEPISELNNSSIYERLCVEPIGENNERYPMCEDQPVQMDCRNEGCKFQEKGKCNNISPAITLNPDKTYVCWTSCMEADNHLPDSGKMVDPNESEMARIKSEIEYLEFQLEDYKEQILVLEALKDHDEFSNNKLNDMKTIFPSDEDILDCCPIEENALINAYQMGAHWMRDEIRNKTEYANYLKSESEKWDKSIQELNHDREMRKSILILPDGTTVDLTKPIQGLIDGTWYDVLKYIGMSTENEFVCEAHNVFDTDFAEFMHIRNKPEPELKPGDRVWYRNHGETWDFGFVHDFNNGKMYVENQIGRPLIPVETRPAFIDGNPQYPPFKD